jgi:hypothetical protein
MFLLPQFLQITIVTETIMATNHFATAFALPCYLLHLKEFFHSMVSNVLQIAYQTHFVVSSVSFVNVFQSATWKVFALETEGDFTFGQFGALLL